MLEGPFLEGLNYNRPIWELRAMVWDAVASLIVQYVIHCHNALIPNSLSLELLTKIAAIVDYYDCHDVAKPFVDRSIKDLWSYGKECMLQMSIPWIFIRVVVLLRAAVCYGLVHHGLG